MLLGACMPYAFSPFDFKFLAIFCLAVWIHLFLRGRAFATGFAFGLGWFGLGGWWLIQTFHHYGGVPYPLAALALLILGAVLALFPAIWAWLCWRLLDNEAMLLIWFPALAVFVEWARGGLFTGLPWTTLGNLVLDTPAVGWAAYAGVYGAAFLPAILSASVLLLIRRNSLRWGIIGLGLSAMLIWLAPPPFQPKGEVRTAALIQGNIPQDVKWNAGFLNETMQRYVRESERAARQVDVIIWPEAAVPFFPSRVPTWDGWLRKKMQSWSVPVLYGGIRKIAGAHTAQNGMYLSVPDSNRRGFAGKQHLVPFGEYIPSWIPFLHKMIPVIADFHPAADSGVLESGSAHYGSLVCYEAIFPEQARARVRAGANVLVNITNDAWYGHTPAAWQHLQSARMRAVESGRYLLRAANTGITAVIAPDGSITHSAPWFIETTVFGAFRTSNKITPYERWGNMVLLLLLFPSLTLVMLRVRTD